MITLPVPGKLVIPCRLTWSRTMAAATTASKDIGPTAAYELMKGGRKCGCSSHIGAHPFAQHAQGFVFWTRGELATKTCAIFPPSFPDLDVRTIEEFSAGHPPGSINIPVLVQTAAGGP